MYSRTLITSILGKDQLMKYLKILVSMFLTILAFFRGKILLLEASVFQKVICSLQIQLSLKSR
jgi:hypothetical protein